MKKQIKTTKQRRYKKLVTIMFILSTIILSSCNINNKENTIKAETQQISITDNEKEKYKTDLLRFIQIKETTDIFSEDFLNNLDEDFNTLQDAEIKQCYFSNNAIYIQINDTHMFRFQLNTEDKIESYIVYKIEA